MVMPPFPMKFTDDFEQDDADTSVKWYDFETA